MKLSACESARGFCFRKATEPHCIRVIYFFRGGCSHDARRTVQPEPVLPRGYVFLHVYSSRAFLRLSDVSLAVAHSNGKLVGYTTLNVVYTRCKTTSPMVTMMRADESTAAAAVAVDRVLLVDKKYPGTCQTAAKRQYRHRFQCTQRRSYTIRLSAVRRRPTGMDVGGVLLPCRRCPS